MPNMALCTSVSLFAIRYTSQRNCTWMAILPFVEAPFVLLTQSDCLYAASPYLLRIPRTQGPEPKPMAIRLPPTGTLVPHFMMVFFVLNGWPLGHQCLTSHGQSLLGLELLLICMGPWSYIGLYCLFAHPFVAPIISL